MYADLEDSCKFPRKTVQRTWGVKATPTYWPGEQGILGRELAGAKSISFGFPKVPADGMEKGWF